MGWPTTPQQPKNNPAKEPSGSSSNRKCNEGQPRTTVESDVPSTAATNSLELGPHYLRLCSSECRSKDSSSVSSSSTGTMNWEPDFDQGPRVTEGIEDITSGPVADFGNPEVSQSDLVNGKIKYLWQNF